MYRLLVFLGLVSTALHADGGYEDRRDAAELAFAQKSYREAYRVYSDAMAQLELKPADARWAAFRMADCRWREQAAAEQSDPSRFNEAREALEHLIRDVKRVEDQDRVWAEVHESLGDSYWRRGEQNWYAAWPHYQQALEWWAGQSDLEAARPRYLAIVRTCARPDWVEPWYRYGNFGNRLPFDVLENVLTISQTDEDRAWANYMIAVSAQQEGGGPNPNRVPNAFEAALAAGKKSAWLDDALFNYAQWMEYQGRAHTDDEGALTRRPDYVKAVELYRRLLAEFKEGETRYRDDAKNLLENIVKPAVSVGVETFFLPGSEISFMATWRNVKKVDYTLYAIDLVKDVNLEGRGDQSWLEAINIADLKKVHTLKKDTQDDGTHQPGQDVMKVDKSLAPGAYLLVASAKGAAARELVLVTEAALALKTGGSKALAWFCHAVDGAPLPGGQVKIWQRYWENDVNHWRLITAETGSNGLAAFVLPEGGHETIAFASNGKQQALAAGHAAWYRANTEQRWKIYAFTDRTAYRPGETVQWKFMARIHDGSSYATPGDRVLNVTVNDPRGAKVLETNLTLNAFGCAWSEVAVTDQMPLGEFHVTFKEDNRHVGQASLFRLEEFKLPEFKVAVRTPEKDGRRQTFLLGDIVEAEIQADYYSGGPVANASVEVVVRKRPYYRSWFPPREFGWFYSDSTTERHWRRSDGEVVKQETVKTDAEGRARVKFETQRSGQEIEYFVEARVTDASRREIVGANDVRVGNQRYFVYATPDNRLRSPGQKAHITLRALDANDQPLGVTGKVAVARLVWKDNWTNQWGRVWAGRYEEKEVSVQGVTIATNGEAEFVFTPKETGYYVARWRSPQEGGRPVTAECGVWVATEKETDIGYLHAGGVEIVVDKDTFREGETAAVMLATPASGRWVLFGVEGQDLYDYQVVKLEGAVKLVSLPVLEKHVPDIYLTAACFSDAQFSADQKQVIVPPVKHYLSVTVTTDRAAYQPREDAKLQIAVTDHAGKPVEAEVALAVADEAVLYVQQDLAGDPREFFFGSKRGQHVHTWSSMNAKPLRRVKAKGREVETDELSNVDLGHTGAWFRGGEFGDSFYGDRRRQIEAGLVENEEMATLSSVAAPMMASGAVLESAPQSSSQEPVVVVRSDFRATAFWQADLVTDAKGRAAATVTLPDSLTSWQGKARVLTKDNRFGIADVSFPARLPLTCRLQAPRFFVVGDTCTVSAVIQNNTDELVPVNAELAVSGLSLLSLKPETRNLKPHAETRVDWTVAATTSGEAKLTATAKGGKIGDAMEKSYPVYDHGIEKFLGASTKMRGESATLRINLPAARRADTTALSVQVAPSIAVTMLDALPYLANYPYGCTEQTMSRFLSSVVVAKTLKDLGLPSEVVANKLFGGIEAANRANRTNTLHALDGMVAAGLERLYDFQHGDGGWGWWKEGDSDPYMTAYVLWGLALAKDAGIDIRGGVVGRGLEWLEKKLVEAEDHPDLQAWELHALSAHRRSSKFASVAMANLWEKRDGLNAYSRSLFLLATVNYSDPDQHAVILAQNLRDGVFKDESPDESVLLQSASAKATADKSAILPTARWGAVGSWWRWSEGPIESTAFALKALLAAKPDDDLIEPAMNWLVKNRRGAQWSNTRDTAYVLLALSDYLHMSKETSERLTYDVVVNGAKVATQSVTPETALGAPSRFEISRDVLRDGTNDIRIVRTTGEGPLYVSAYATFFSLEEPITPAGHELFVKRQYFKIVPRPTLLKGVVYDKMPLNDSDAVRSGERIEVMIAMESKNDYEYLMFEDLKPAGFEAVEVRSGGGLYAEMLTEPAGRRRFAAGLHDVDASDFTGKRQWIYPELRDRKVALFADKLPQGLWELRYELRAETPGHFHALPVLGHAMYVPEIRANSAEIRVTVEE